jgi:hypothetical protein
VKEIALDDGTKIRNFQEIKEAAKAHFKNLYSEQGEADPEATASMLANILVVITQMENTKLMKEIEESKIINAIWTLHLDKAPGQMVFQLISTDPVGPLSKLPPENAAICSKSL